MTLYEEVADEMLSTEGWRIAAANTTVPDRAGLIAKLRERFPDEAEFRTFVETAKAEATVALSAPGVVGVGFELPPGWTPHGKGSSQ